VVAQPARLTMSRTVLIIGGGPSGLTAALRLSTHGYAVTLVEQAERLGGRLLAGDSRAGPCDALPPVVMGHQTATLALLDELGTGERVPLSNSLRLEFQFPGGRLACLMQPWLPAPFHTIACVMLFGGLPWSDRWRLFDVIERSWEGDPPLPHDLEECTADDWLTPAIGPGPRGSLDAAGPFLGRRRSHHDLGGIPRKRPHALLLRRPPTRTPRRFVGHYADAADRSPRSTPCPTGREPTAERRHRVA